MLNSYFKYFCKLWTYFLKFNKNIILLIVSLEYHFKRIINFCCDRKQYLLRSTILILRQTDSIKKWDSRGTVPNEHFPKLQDHRNDGKLHFFSENQRRLWCDFDEIHNDMSYILINEYSCKAKDCGKTFRLGITESERSY